MWRKHLFCIHNSQQFQKSLKSVPVCGEACNCSEDSTTRIPLLWNHHDWNSINFLVKAIAGMDGGCFFCEDFRAPELPQVDIRLYMAGEVCGWIRALNQPVIFHSALTCEWNARMHVIMSLLKRFCNSFQGVIIKRLYQSFNHWPMWVCCHGWFFRLIYVLVQQLGGLFESHILLVALLLPLGKLWLKGLDFQALLVHGLIRLLVLIQHTGRKFTRSITSLVSSIIQITQVFPK